MRVFPADATFPGAGDALSGSVSGVLRRGLLSGVSGVVRDRMGRPQIGALVELLDAHYGILARTFTDDHGRYSLPRLGPGVYQLKATGALFLPTIRPDLRLLADSRVIVNLTLSTLYQALQWLPAQAPAADSTPDDWSWTLRVSANRPLLRALNPAQARLAAANGAQDVLGPVVFETPVSADSARTHRIAIRSGLSRFGEGGTEQQALWRPNEAETRALMLEAESSLAPGGFGRLSTTAAYREELTPERSMITIVTLSDRPSIASAPSVTRSGQDSGLATMRVRSASTAKLGDLAEVSAGTELAFARFGGQATTVGSHPFAAVTGYAGGTTVRYSVATARSASDADHLEEEASEDAPLVSEVDGELRQEQGLHQQVQVSRHIRSWTGEVSVFHDSLAHPIAQGALSGDEAAIDSSNVLFDPASGTIAVSGQGYRGGGVMAMLRDQLSPDTWLSLRYAMGEALASPSASSAPGSLDEAVHQIAAHQAQMAALSAGTRIRQTGTVVRGSYRWQPASTLTSVAPFDAAVPDAYLGLSIRQPLHMERAGTGRLEAILDVRNLLAQGYRPFLSQDGTTVYFAQTQRCIAGGISFSF